MEATSCEDIVAQGQVVRGFRKIDWRLNWTMKTLDANSRNNMAWKRSFNRTTEISWRVHIYNVIDHQ